MYHSVTGYMSCSRLTELNLRAIVQNQSPQETMVKLYLLHLGTFIKQN